MKWLVKLLEFPHDVYVAIKEIHAVYAFIEVTSRDGFVTRQYHEARVAELLGALTSADEVINQLSADTKVNVPLS